MTENVEIKFLVDDKQVDQVKRKIDILKKDNKISFNLDAYKLNTDINSISNTLKNNLGSSIKGVTSQLEGLTGIKFSNVINEANKMKDIFTQTTSVFNNLSGLMKGSNLSSNININNNAINSSPGFLKGTAEVFAGMKLSQINLGDIFKNIKPNNVMSKNDIMTDVDSFLKKHLPNSKGTAEEMLGKSFKEYIKNTDSSLANFNKSLNSPMPKVINIFDKFKKDSSEWVAPLLKSNSGSINLGMLAGMPGKIVDNVAGGIESILPTLGSFTAKLLPIAGIFVGIGAAAGVAYLKIGQGFWDADKQIIKATGSLKGYENAIFDMASSSKYKIDDLASSFSKLAPSLSYDFIQQSSGSENISPNVKGLEDLTIMVQRIRGLTGEQINERDISGMFNKWSISADNYKKTLDEVFYVHQQTGTSFSTIIQKVTQNKAIFDEMGWGVQQSTLAVAEWEKQGYDASNVAMALKKAANTMVDDYGVTNLSAGFAELQADLTGSKSRTEKLDEAAKFFGKRMSIDVVNAIIDGKIKLTEFTNVDFSKAKGSVDDTAKKVKTIGSAWQGVINKLDVFIGKMMCSESAWKSFEGWAIGALDNISTELDKLMNHGFWDYMRNSLEPSVAKALGIKQDKKTSKKSTGTPYGNNTPSPISQGSGYDLNVAQQAYNTAKARGVSDKVMLALFEAGIVESNMRNLNYGDRDSQGFLQQRPSQGWGSVAQVTNVPFATNSFLSEAIRNEGKYSTSGKLAQGVQRSAYPDRYDEVEKQAKALLSQISGYDYTSSSSNKDPNLKDSITERQKAASDNVQVLKEKWQYAQKLYEENKNSSTLEVANAAYKTYANARDSFNQSWMKDAELAKEQASSMVEDENQRWNIQKEYQQFAKDFVDIQKQKYNLSNSQWEGNKKDDNLKAMANEAYANYQSSRDSYNNTWLSGNERIKAQLEAQIEDQQRLNSLLSDQKSLVDSVTSAYSQLYKFSGAFDKLKIEKFSPGKLERRTNKNFAKWQKWTDDLAQLQSMGVGAETIYELRNMGVDSLGIAEGLIKATSEQRNKIIGNINNMSNIALNNAVALVKHEVDGTILVKSDMGNFNLSKDQVEKIVADAINSGSNRFTR